MRNFFGVGKKKKDQGERIAQSIGRLLEPSQSIARSLSYECAHPFRRNLEAASTAAEPDGAFNAANREYEPELFSAIRDGWMPPHARSRG